jgi:NSS family neurotransmitter:Na+ symporter
LISLVLLGTDQSLYNVDVIDKWSNEVGIVLSAVVMMVLVMWVARRGKEMSFHLSELSTFKVNRVWRFLVTVIGPLALGYILVVTVIDLLANPYGGYDPTYLLIAGWGVIVVGVVVSFLAVLVPWHEDPLKGFVPWPQFGASQLPGSKAKEVKS